MTFFVWMASTSESCLCGNEEKNWRNVVEALPSDFQLGLSPVVLEESWSDLSDLHAQSRDRGVEGFMLKRKNSNYKSGRVKGDWYKWKVDPLHADMVVVSAQLGRGKRSELYSDYSLAVWSDSQELVVVAKAYSGLSDKELKEVDRFVRANAMGALAPFVASALKSSLRLPSKAFVFRASQIRRGLEISKNQALAKDKKAAEADTLESVRKLAQSTVSLNPEGPKTDEDGNLLLFE